MTQKGLSNSVLTNPWPKVKQGKEIFANILKENAEGNEEKMIESLFALLRYADIIYYT